jgi:hypothetical protein
MAIAAVWTVPTAPGTGAWYDTGRISPGLGPELCATGTPAWGETGAAASGLTASAGGGVAGPHSAGGVTAETSYA